jgi:hypothetical protein
MAMTESGQSKATSCRQTPRASVFDAAGIEDSVVMPSTLEKRENV